MAKITEKDFKFSFDGLLERVRQMTEQLSIQILRNKEREIEIENARLLRLENEYKIELNELYGPKQAPGSLKQDEGITN